MPKKVFLIILLLLGLALGLFLLSQSTILSSRASTPTTPNRENSYLFASPIQAKADGQEKIRVTVFLLNSQGLGVPGERINLNYPSSLTLETLQTTTDDLGKATFNLSSTTPGKFEISASTPSFNFSQKIKLLFL